MNVIVCDGDSLTAEYYPGILDGLLDATWIVSNYGAGGQTLVSMTADAAAQVDPTIGTGLNVCVCWGGTNDLYFGASAATTYSRLVSYCQARQSAGWTVFVLTFLPRTNSGTPGDFETSRQTVNTDIRNNFATFADYLVDVAADSRIGDAGDETDTTYYNGDNVHLNLTGYGIIAQAVYDTIAEFLGDLAMAASDARPIPRKNTAFRVTFPIFDADGDLVTGAAGLDSEISIDGGTFADCTNEATEIATSSGIYYLDLTSSEMNGDTVAVIVKTSTSGAKTTPIILYPEEAGDIRADLVDGAIDAATFAAGAINAAAIATDAIDADALAADAVAEIQSGLATAPALATVDTVVDAIKIQTDLIPAAPAAAGDIPSASSIAAAVWAYVVEGALTAVQAYRIMLSVLAGKSTGGGTTTVAFRDMADSKNRVDATVDADGNRTAVTRDGT